ncbi:unnamed protein product, partial [Brassica oleracea]
SYSTSHLIKAIEDQKSRGPTRKGLLISRYGIELVILETVACARG